MGRKTLLERLEREDEKEVCLKSEIERERERFSQMFDIFLDMFGPFIGPHTTRPLQPH